MRDICLNLGRDEKRMLSVCKMFDFALQSMTIFAFREKEHYTGADRVHIGPY